MVDTLQPIQTLQPQPQGGVSADAIAQLRRYARALSEQRSKPPIYTWANGLDDLSAKVMGGIAARRADEMERQGYRVAAADRAAQAAPYLGGGAVSGILGASPPADGGTASPVPFTPAS